MAVQDLGIAILLLVCVVTSASADQVGRSTSQSACLRECSGIDVPYPFGLFGDSAECFLNKEFMLTCNHSFTPPRLLYAGDTPVETGDTPVLNTSLEEGTMIFEYLVAFTRYNLSGVEHVYATAVSLGEISPFTFSSSRNMFVVVGCETIGLITDYNASQFGTGCVAVCIDRTTVIKSPVNLPPKVAPCKGIGCCRTDIPTGLKTLNISLLGLNNHTGILEYNPIEFGYVTGTNLSLLKRKSDQDGKEYDTSQVVVDWAIGNLTCEQVEQSGGKPICGANTDCINSTNGVGYRCSCLPGFQLGNPYTTSGCIDIDECSDENRGKYPCFKGRCKNTPGNYTCHCSFGYGGDGKVGCSLKPFVKILAAIVALSFLAIFSYLLYWVYRRKIRERNQQKNGGWLLKRLAVKIYKETELEKATKNFSTQLLIGEGGNGYVYKGLLPRIITDEKVTTSEMDVAVKKSKVVDEKQIEQFLNEVDIVSKVSHKNVVKLLGICIESKVPMLVYEFVPNGTLSDHIHGKCSQVILNSWSMYLKIATGMAQALHRMHESDPPIIHRDIKPANILLDGKHIAKVADFGASRLIPPGRTITPVIEGTFGYVDPEYLQTGYLTEKSDVYGFGIVLIELLTKEIPTSRGGFVGVFISAVKDNQVGHLLKVSALNEHEMEQVQIVAKLAIKCVAMQSKKRPTMTEVCHELNELYKEYNTIMIDETGDEVLADDFITKSVCFQIEP